MLAEPRIDTLLASDDLAINIAHYFRFASSWVPRMPEIRKLRMRCQCHQGRVAKE